MLADNVENLMKGNRCAIVVIWDEAGSLPSYMKLYVEKLLEACSKVIVVFNGNCSDNAQRQIQELGGVGLNVYRELILVMILLLINMA